VDGKKVATYTIGFTKTTGYLGDTDYTMQLNYQSSNVYFLGRLIWAEGSQVTTDRLGSVRNGGVAWPGSLGYQAQYPYGVEYTPQTVNDREKYATYTRDSVTGLDYAMNRYYSSVWGRFLSPDPYGKSVGPGNPQSWNRYGYAGNDPVNHNDPSGLDDFAPDPDTGVPWLFECFEAGIYNAAIDCSQGDGIDIWSNAPDCGFGYGTFCVMWPLLPDVPPPTPSKPNPPQITLNEIGDCVYPLGTKGTPFWTLEVEYQVLVNGLPAVGLSTLAGDGVSMITESITNASFPVTGNGVWCTSTYTACPNPQAIGELTAQGTFWDGLAGNGKENQGFLLNGTQPLSVITYGGATVFQNVLNSLRRTISVGNGAVVGNRKTRQCGPSAGDPEP
jgi:RHS repeat-associated protein